MLAAAVDHPRPGCRPVNEDVCLVRHRAETNRRRARRGYVEPNQSVTALDDDVGRSAGNRPGSDVDAVPAIRKPGQNPESSVVALLNSNHERKRLHHLALLGGISKVAGSVPELTGRVND